MNQISESEIENIIFKTTDLLSSEISVQVSSPNRYSSQEKKRLQFARNLLEAGRIEEAESLFDEAMKFYKRAMKIFDALSDPIGTVQTLVAMELVHRKRWETIQSLQDELRKQKEITQKIMLKLGMLSQEN